MHPLVTRCFHLIVLVFFFVGKNLYNNEHVAIKLVGVKEGCEKPWSKLNGIPIYFIIEWVMCDMSKPCWSR